MFDLIPPFPPESLPSYRNIVAYPFNAKHMVLGGMFVLGWGSAISVENESEQILFYYSLHIWFLFPGKICIGQVLRSPNRVENSIRTLNLNYSKITRRVCVCVYRTIS